MKLSKLSTVITALVVATIFDLVGVAKQAEAVSLVGLTENNSLVLFNSNNPTNTSTVSVTGVDGLLLGIDRRPANNLIYGLTNTNKIYTINPFTGAASFVSNLSSPFNGGTISGVDFNPVPDRLRVVGANDQNYRINVSSGAVSVDGTLNPGDPSITAAAYTNADNDPATGTTLYTVDYITDALYTQIPPNAGTQVLIGSLGINISSAAGFDIFTDNGVNTAFLAATPTSESGSNLYTIDLMTGAATSVGSISSDKRLIGLTAVPVPEPSVGFGTVLSVGVFALLGRRRKLVK